MLHVQGFEAQGWEIWSVGNIGTTHEGTQFVPVSSALACVWLYLGQAPSSLMLLRMQDFVSDKWEPFWPPFRINYQTTPPPPSPQTATLTIPSSKRKAGVQVYPGMLAIFGRFQAEVMMPLTMRNGHFCGHLRILRRLRVSTEQQRQQI